MCFELKTRCFWRAQLPHWEIESGYYFITIRCANSLPQSVTQKIKEVHKSLAAIEPSNEAFLQLQRQYFQAIDKYADTHQGFCPFRTDSCARAVIQSFEALATSGWQIKHYSLMPNHVHFIAQVHPTSADMHTVLSQWKGATSHTANQILNRSGAFWQRDWFDRVIRSQEAFERVKEYIQQNPVKAGLCQEWQAYPYVR